MDNDILNKLFEKEFGELLIGINGFHFYKKDEIGEGQIGYRCNADYVKLDDWIGDNYFVIGYEVLLGDPILVNVEDDKLPIYSLVRDDYSICYKIANSLEDYRKILKMIMDSDLTVREVVDNLILDIKKINRGLDIDYWKDFLMGVHEDVSTIYSKKND